MASKTVHGRYRVEDPTTACGKWIVRVAHVSDNPDDVTCVGCKKNLDLLSPQSLPIEDTNVPSNPA